jgi:hypothetical protein
MYTLSSHLSILRIANENASDNSTIQWSHLTTLCNSDNNSILLNKLLAKLVFDFDRSKTRLSSDERRSLRQHFLYLAEQCKKLKDFESAKLILLNLADSAYKLPERKCWTSSFVKCLHLGYNDLFYFNMNFKTTTLDFKTRCKSCGSYSYIILHSL